MFSSEDKVNVASIIQTLSMMIYFLVYFIITLNFVPLCLYLTRKYSRQRSYQWYKFKNES